MPSVAVIEIIRKEGYLLDDLEIHRIVEIYQSNNALYEPMLVERYKVANELLLFEPLLESMQLRIEEGYIFYLVYVNGEMIGFNNHHLHRVKIKGTEYPTLEIGTTSVLPEYQNIGIGKSLYTRIDDDAENLYQVDAVTRRTWSTNERQRHLYAKYGFKPFVIMLDHWGVEGVDTILYYKLLNNDE